MSDEGHSQGHRRYRYQGYRTLQGDPARYRERVRLSGIVLGASV